MYWGKRVVAFSLFALASACCQRALAQNSSNGSPTVPSGNTGKNAPVIETVISHVSVSFRNGKPIATEKGPPNKPSYMREGWFLSAPVSKVANHTYVMDAVTFDNSGTDIIYLDLMGAEGTITAIDLTTWAKKFRGSDISVSAGYAHDSAVYQSWIKFGFIALGLRNINELIVDKTTIPVSESLNSRDLPAGGAPPTVGKLLSQAILGVFERIQNPSSYPNFPQPVPAVPAAHIP